LVVGSWWWTIKAHQTFPLTQRHLSGEYIEWVKAKESALQEIIVS